ncbi:response regulator [Thioclava sp. BHET1]|nr:response regulator [Thioclava sp. BHET1]
MALRDTLRIMVVDDMATSRGLIIQALEELRIKNIEVQNNGAGALEALRVKPAHLVISDFNMPVMDGLGLLKSLRETAATRGVGFILVTGRADRETLERGQKLGMNNFLKKPFTTDAMRQCIQAILGQAL